jgi:DNA primase
MWKKVYFPSSGFTKGQVISFYSEIAGVVLPHLGDRPLTLKRYPEGINGEHFYEKNAPSHTPTWVKRFAVPRSEGGSDIHYVLCNDRATLVWATNLAEIEHTLYWPLHQTSIAQPRLFSTWIPVNRRKSWIAVVWRYLSRNWRHKCRVSPHHE